MATAGSVIGGYVSYRLARKGGKAAIEHRFSRRKVDRVCITFERWAFVAIAISALLPPPMPNGSIFVCGGRNAISSKKILGCAYAWPHLQIHDSGLPGSALRSPNNRVHRRTWTPLGSGSRLVTGRHCVGWLLLLGGNKGRKRANQDCSRCTQLGFTTGCV